MAFFCQHIVWLYALLTILGFVLIFTPLTRRYRFTSQLLKMNFLLGGILAGFGGLAGLILRYDYYQFVQTHQHFLSSRMRFWIVRTHPVCLGACLSLMILLFISSEMWRAACAKLPPREVSTGTEPPAPVNP